MKSIQGLLLTTLLIALTVTASAQTSVEPMQPYRSTLTKTDDTGVGLKVGSLPGVSGKYWMSETRAMDVGLAFYSAATAVNVDYLWEFRDFFADMTNRGYLEHLVPYTGVGLITGFGSNTQFFSYQNNNFGLAARFPLGIEFLPRSVRLGAFFEAALDVGVAPVTYGFLTADIGARYYF